jgi:hypothetical protein
MDEDRKLHELDIFVDHNNYEADVRKIFAVIRPQWKTSGIQIKVCAPSSMFLLGLCFVDTRCRKALSHLSNLAQLLLMCMYIVYSTVQMCM